MSSASKWVMWSRVTYHINYYNLTQTYYSQMLQIIILLNRFFKIYSKPLELANRFSSIKERKPIYELLFP